MRSYTHSVSGSERVTHSIWRGYEGADIADTLERIEASEMPGESQLGRDNAAEWSGTTRRLLVHTSRTGLKRCALPV